MCEINPYSLLKTIDVYGFWTSRATGTKGISGDIHKNGTSHLFSNPVNTKRQQQVYQLSYFSSVYPPPRHFFFPFTTLSLSLIFLFPHKNYDFFFVSVSRTSEEDMFYLCGLATHLIWATGGSWSNNI